MDQDGAAHSLGHQGRQCIIPSPNPGTAGFEGNQKETFPLLLLSGFPPGNLEALVWAGQTIPARKPGLDPEERQQPQTA